jgi:phospholipid/cholesterol/gamma-HCH transport system substrate-binding protein
MRKEIQLGLFVLLGIITFAVGILSIKSIHIAGGYRINILYDNVGGLLEKAWVRLCGVEIGRVDKISLGDNQKAVVTAWIKSRVELRRDVKVKIVATGLLGVKYLEITAVSDTAPVLKNGDTINGIDPVGLDAVLNKLAEGGVAENIVDTVKNVKELTERLNLTVTEKRVNRIVKSLTRSAEELEKLLSNLSEIVGDGKQDLKAIVKNIKSITDKLDNIIADVEEGEGAIGKLFSDKEMGEDLKQTVESIKITSNEAKKALGRFTLFKSYWSYELRRDAVFGKYKSDIGLEIRPKPDKFYYIGISNITSNIAVGDEEPENTFDLNIGRDFGPLTVYAGFIRSKGGVGLGFRPLWNWDALNKLELTGEIYDFERQTPEKPRINVGARVWVSRYVRLSGYTEDMSHLNNFHVSGNLVFEDEDIAYLLGFTGLIPK